MLRTLPTKGFTNMVDTNQERFPEANMRLSESATPPNNSRSHQSSGNTTNTATVSKNSTAMERKSSERPSTRDRRDRFRILTILYDGQNNQILSGLISPT